MGKTENLTVKMLEVVECIFYALKKGNNISQCLGSMQLQLKT